MQSKKKLLEIKLLKKNYLKKIRNMQKSGMSEEMRQAIYDLSIEMQLKAELQDVLLQEIYENKVTMNFKIK